MTVARRAHAAPLILIVDDNEDLRELVSDALIVAGYRVRTACNGKVALEQAELMRPDLIVLDLMMPVMNGWQFLEAQGEDPEDGSRRARSGRHGRS